MPGCLVAQAALTAGAASAREQHRDAWWIEETLNRVNAVLALFHQLSTLAASRICSVAAAASTGPGLTNSAELTPDYALRFAGELQSMLCNQPTRDSPGDPSLQQLAERLRELLSTALETLRALSADLEKIERTAERLAQETEFGFLVDPYRQILSIGYEMGKKKRHEACYDLIASEARIATFLAIARGDLLQQSWGKLGRDHTRVNGRFLLLSWSGTMFEYLMPALWMRSYPDTLIARTQDACVYVQRAFGTLARHSLGCLGVRIFKEERPRPLPLLCLRSAKFRPFGPRLRPGPVISPYSTFLALTVDPPEALRNLRRMESAGWVGPYGFYESADYSVSSRKPVVVREWMAHHLGMSLLAIANSLRSNVVQQWFHAHPMIQATELLLQEIPVNTAVLKARLEESGSDSLFCEGQHAGSIARRYGCTLINASALVVSLISRFPAVEGFLEQPAAASIHDSTARPVRESDPAGFPIAE